MKAMSLGIEVLIVLIVGIVVLVGSLFLFGTVKASGSQPAYENALRDCCPKITNPDNAGNPGSVICIVPKNLDSDGNADGKMSASDLKDKTNVQDLDSFCRSQYGQ